jgi:hypothetical protein
LQVAAASAEADATTASEGMGERVSVVLGGVVVAVVVGVVGVM